MTGGVASRSPITQAPTIKMPLKAVRCHLLSLASCKDERLTCQPPAPVLDQTQVRYSYKQHCMVSLTVAASVNQNEWHLPTYDPRNENKYHYKLHSLDIYFWTQQNALQFVNGVRRVLPPQLVEVLDEPGPPPQPAGMSSVVQKLENVAISDPQYGTQRPAGGPSQPQQPQQGGPQGIPPPPISAVQSNAAQPATFAPMAYNPAAPAAPEQVRHREKTPPPDEDPLNPLAVAVAYDYQGQPFTPAFPPQGQFIPGVTSPGMTPHGFGQHPGMQRAATMPVHAGLASPGLRSPYGTGFPASPGMPPPPGPPPMQHAHSQPQIAQHHPHQQQPIAQPTPPIASPGLSPPPGGYSNYTYAPQPSRPTASQDYAVHQQGYQPTEAEARADNPHVGPKSSGKLEENAARLERGVTGMFKKFEKKFG